MKNMKGQEWVNKMYPTHFESNGSRTVVETNNEDKFAVTVYNREGNVICVVSAARGKIPTMNVFDGWDVTK
jgi:hypothetical protein